MNAPPCEKCCYYRPGRYTRTGQCARYIAYRGRGKIVFEFADQVRFDKNKCGPQGKFFMSEKEYVSRERLDLISRLFEEEE